MNKWMFVQTSLWKSNKLSTAIHIFIVRCESPLRCFALNHYQLILVVSWHQFTCCGFCLGISPLFFLSVSAIPRKTVYDKPHAALGRTDQPGASHSGGSVSLWVTASGDCPASTLLCPAPACPDCALSPSQATSRPAPCHCPHPFLQSSCFFRLSSTWKAPTRFAHYIK